MARILKKIEIREISAVDKPAQKHARAVIMKRHTDYTTDELVGLIQKSVDAGEADNEPKYKYMEAITARANDLRVAGDTDAQAFTKAITTDEPCKLLFKLMKSAPGSEVPPPDAKQDDVPHVDAKGPAEQAMEEAVATHRADAAAEGRTLSREQAFTEVYMHPANLGFKQRYDAEMLAKRSPQ
ncbi:MAG: hypothetical protein ACLPSW_16435 [Roseiarcus sp.]